MSNQFIYSVIVSLHKSVPQSTFDYACQKIQKLEVGQIVKVPFGKKAAWGVIEKLQEDRKDIQIKQIIKVFDGYILSGYLMRFINWVAEWNFTSKGSVLKLVLSNIDIIEKENKPIGWIMNTNPDISKLKKLFPNFKLTKKRKQIIRTLSQTKPILTKELIDQTGVSKRTISELKKLNIINSMEVSSDISLPEFKVLRNSNIILNSSQRNAVEKINRIKSNNKFDAVLLDGLTGSGKTEVYFEIIAETLKQRKQALVLLPEIYLSSEWSMRFKNSFGITPLVWHSNLSKKVRRETWDQIIKGKVNVIVGARSALFLPFRTLGLIVIDEEHDHSFKQEEGVLYNARDMGIIRAKIENIPVILSTATPSLETWQNTQTKKFSHIELPKRIGDAELPRVKLIDMKGVNLPYNKWISPTLKDEISKNLVNRNLTLLFLNRRGYAPLKLCSSCGYRLGCKNCQSWLVEHKKNNLLICHQCGIQQKLPEICDECSEKETFISCGPGVERLEEEILDYFPDIRIEILSSDTIQSSEIMNDFLKRIRNGKIDLIIGTQIISKGHNFKNLTLVGVIDADMSLSGGDLRASEKAFQVLHQVSGRAGRENKKGLVVIQTYDPKNQVIEALSKNNRDEFLKIESKHRKEINLPPFGKLAAIIISSKNQRELEAFSINLKKKSPSFQNVMILGPAPAPMYYLRGKYRYRFLIKSTKEVNIQKVIKDWVYKIKIPYTIKLVVDIDPYSFL